MAAREPNGVGTSQLALAIGRLEGRLHEMASSIDRIGHSQKEAATTVSQWKEEMIRLQERTKTRATVAAVLAIVIPSLLVLAIRFLDLGR